MKAFKLKEDIRLYADENMMREILVIKARSVIDFSATYDVMDMLSGDLVGAFKRKGFKSMLRDEWAILDNDGNEIGQIVEDSMALALVRRLICNLLPQTFTGTLHQQKVFSFTQNFGLFVKKLNLDFTMDTTKKLDRRLGIAAAVLLCTIEGRQK